LTASTTNFIHGNAPYLTFDGGQTRVTDMNNLLGISFSDGRTYSPNNNSSTNPIILPDINETLINVNMLVPTNANSIALNTLIGAPYNYWGDDDGDGQGSNGIAVTGNLTLTITDKNNQKISRNTALDICNAPYKVVLSSDGGTLSTQYGVPKSSDFSGSSATYYINPKAPPKICFAKPTLRYGSDTEISGIDFRGPASMWDPSRGFIVQSRDPSSYGLNFPTTGANNLYFDLDIGGVGPLRWDPVTHDGITATMTPNSSGTTVRVTLTGPVANEAQWQSDSPSIIYRPSLPQTFELVGRDSLDNAIIKYGFQLKKWFINRGNKSSNYSLALSWCRSIGYSVPQVKDLTNAVCSGPWSADNCQGAIGAIPSSTGNHYQHRINAGFFTEWGYLTNYIGAGTGHYYLYWTRDQSGSEQFIVYPYGGDVYMYNPAINFYEPYSFYALCTSS